MYYKKSYFQKFILNYLIFCLFVSFFFNSCFKIETDTYSQNKVKLESPPLPYFPVIKTNYFPDENHLWEKKSFEEAKINKEKFATLEDYAFGHPPSPVQIKGVLTNSLLIVKNSKIVYEKYNRGFNQNSLNQIFSVGKCFVNAIYGVAFTEKKINLDTPIYKYFEIFNENSKKEITIRHLLNMSSGIKWKSDMESNLLNFDEFYFLWGSENYDLMGYLENIKMQDKPGTFLNYSTGNTFLLMSILQKILLAENEENKEKDENDKNDKNGENVENNKNELKKNSYEVYLKEKLLTPLKIDKYFIEKDSKGRNTSSYTSTRSLAKLGLLFLHKGKWKNKIIFNNDWFNFSRTITPASAIINNESQWIQKEGFTAHIYTNTGFPKANIKPHVKNAPANTLICEGTWKQRIYIIPDYDMVVVRTGEDKNENLAKDDVDENYGWNDTTFFKLLNESLELKN